MQDNNELIRGKVAKLVNDRVIAITVGSNDGVKKGMYFRVLEPQGSDVSDPGHRREPWVGRCHENNR